MLLRVAAGEEKASNPPTSVQTPSRSHTLSQLSQIRSSRLWQTRLMRVGYHSEVIYPPLSGEDHGIPRATPNQLRAAAKLFGGRLLLKEYIQKPQGYGRHPVEVM